MHNLLIPGAMIVITSVVFIGAQILSVGGLDEDIQRSIATSLDTDDMVTLEAMQEVNKGYGVCGQYRVADAPNSPEPFFYSKVDASVELDSDSRRYRASCE
ncbi:hypothetical protein ACUN9Y_21125 [Halomonas sp. V046]|uniref:hypothetical protein n=1 Tax=Halomonas sp. V046 TaxID=3459611 RepID=UPI004044DB47